MVGETLGFGIERYADAVVLLGRYCIAALRCRVNRRCDNVSGLGGCILSHVACWR